MSVTDDIRMRQELERLHQASHAWALACCGYRDEEAADLLQSSYEKVLDGRARYGGRSSIKTWFFGVIRRTAAGRRRAEALRGLLLLRAAAREPQEPYSPAAGSVDPADRDLILTALGALPRRQREVLELAFYHDLSLSEAADVMGLSLGSARTHYHRGKQALASALAPLREAHT